MQERIAKKDEIQRILQEKTARYLNLQQTLRAYQIVYDLHQRQLEELLITKEALKNMKKRNVQEFDGFASLGSGVYIFVNGSIGEKILVNIGANVGVYMSIDDAIATLDRREGSIRGNLENTAKILQEIVNIMAKLEQEIVALQNYLSQLK
ncbi:MAG: hypothetical protein Q6363_005025 [Candidatus Njordarchaeota archaeon]